MVIPYFKLETDGFYANKTLNLLCQGAHKRKFTLFLEETDAGTTPAVVKLKL